MMVWLHACYIKRTTEWIKKCMDYKENVKPCRETLINLQR